MRKRPTQRATEANRPTMLESLELRRLLSATVFDLTSNGALSLTSSITWTPAVQASANLTAGRDGSLWYSADHALERVSGGVTTGYTLPASWNDAVITDLAVTADGSAVVLLTRSGHSSLLEFSGGQFTSLTAPSNVQQIASTAGGLWLTLGNGQIEQLGNSPIAVANIDHFTGLTADAAGNAWFTATSNGRGIIGKVTPTGAITTYTVNGQPSDLAVAGTDVWYIDTVNPAGINHFVSSGVSLREPGDYPLNSLAAASDGSLFVMSAGELGKRRATIGITTSGNIFSTLSYSTAAVTNTYGNYLLTLQDIIGRGFAIVSNVDTSTPSTPDNQQTMPSDNNPTTQPGDTTVPPSQSNGSSSSSQTPAGIPRRINGDLGIFEGEFSITPRQDPLPPRQKTADTGRTQSNAGNGRIGSAANAIAGIPQATTYEGTGATIAGQAPTEMLVLAFPLTDSAFLPQFVPVAPDDVATAPARPITAQPKINTDLAAISVASADSTESSPHNEDVSRWWKLMISLSTAAGIELGRGGQRYYRV